MSATTTFLSAVRTISRPTITHDQTVVRFVGLQFFCLIYLQKLALFSLSFPLSVPMLVMFGSIAWMVLKRQMIVDSKRLAVFLIFIGCCLFSESFDRGSVSSLLMVVALYGCLTTIAEVSEATYRRIFNMFIRFMVLPALIVLEQYSYQTLTHHTDPLRLTSLVPARWLLQGFNYDGHYPWFSYFVRPQGFFFLEPSFLSAFTAMALIVEITYFRRLSVVLLMAMATILSHGATGITMLVCASPFLLGREKPPVVVAIVAASVSAITLALALQLPLPLLSRTHELDRQGSSAAERLVMPAETFGNLVFDPSYIFLGDGAGSMTTPMVRAERGNLHALKNQYNGPVPVSNPWPIVKVLEEYGLLGMITFVIFYLTGINGRFNVPMKVGLSVIYLFTGGYLLSPIMVELLGLSCFMLRPNND